MGTTSPSASLSRAAAGGAGTLGVSRGPRLAILGILAICQRAYLTLWRQPVLIISTMLFPVIYLLVLGNSLVHWPVRLLFAPSGVLIGLVHFSMPTMILILAAGGFLLGCAWAFFLGKGISRPMTAMSDFACAP